MVKDNIHPLFFFPLELPVLVFVVVVVGEGRCENNNLSRVFMCVDGDMLRSYSRRAARTHTHYSFRYYPTATSITRLHYSDARTHPAVEDIRSPSTLT